MIPHLHRLTWLLIGFVFTLLVGLGLALPAEAAGPTLSPQKCGWLWDAPTTNTDGTPLQDLAGYNVYVGNAPGDFTNPLTQVPAASPAPAAGTVVSWDCRTANISSGQHYITIRAVDTAGNPSANATPPAGATWTQADGAPFGFDPVAPGAAGGLRPTP